MPQMIRVGSHGGKVILSAAANSATVPTAGVPMTTITPSCQECIGMAKWTFVMEFPTTVTAAVVTIWGTVDNVGETSPDTGYMGGPQTTDNTWAWLQLGTLTLGATINPITFNFPLTGVTATLAGYTGSGTVTVKAFVAP